METIPLFAAVVLAVHVSDTHGALTVRGAYLYFWARVVYLFLYAAGMFETEPADMLVIEDSVAGVTGAVAAGMRVIGFTGASHTYPGHGEALMDAGATTVVRRLVDVPATIEALRQWRPKLV